MSTNTGTGKDAVRYDDNRDAALDVAELEGTGAASGILRAGQDATRINH